MESLTTGVVMAALMPHPPIVVAGVGRGREEDAAGTVGAMRALAERIVACHPETIVVISPHSPRHPGQFGIWREDRLAGNLGQFRAPSEHVDLPQDDAFSSELELKCRARGIGTWRVMHEDLDHGAMVPLCFLRDAGWTGTTVLTGLNYPGEGQLVEFGEAIREAAESLARRTVVLASGDMSHRLVPNAPGGYHRDAHRFDETFVRLVTEGRYDEIVDFNGELRSIAGEDVVDSSIVAMAAARFDRTNHRVLNYEGPFGVGYSIAVFTDLTQSGSADNPCEQLPEVARKAVETFLHERRFPPPSDPAEPLLKRVAGVFVTIRNRAGELRGCIGTISPQKRNIVDETADRAIMAATRDPRFTPVSEEELPDLRYEVSVLTPPERVESEHELDPMHFGVIIEDGRGRRAVMLPGIESLDTVEKQLAATRHKAGIPPDAPVNIQRFEVEKYIEEVRI